MSSEKTISPAQQEVLQSGLLTSGFNCILQMPTGSGKTWLAEQAIAHVLSQNKRAIYGRSLGFRACLRFTSGDMPKRIVKIKLSTRK